mmetsp:Transcript_19962/g.37276  ORF Transcript_19962/g.37276 Transcript_19962/m.37276 type:complete len:86 (-) Transcript_19962:161-418(-)
MHHGVCQQSFSSFFVFRSVNFFPRKAYALHIPVSALFLFLAAPLLYAGLNSLTVPKEDSLDTLRDKHSRKVNSISVMPQDESSLV